MLILLVQGPHFENPWLGIRERSGHYTREGGRFSSKGSHIPEADSAVACSPDCPTLGSTALAFREVPREVQGSFQRTSLLRGPTHNPSLLFFTLWNNRGFNALQKISFCHSWVQNAAALYSAKTVAKANKTQSLPWWVRQFQEGIH